VGDKYLKVSRCDTNEHEKEMSSSAILNDKDIRRELDSGGIVYRHPDGRLPHIGNCSIDVTLGNYYFVEKEGSHTVNPWVEGQTIWNPIPNYACREIVLHPGHSILAHTHEYIGGRGNIAMMMKARSSLGRTGITVCRDAGLGDIGYINRWTMEMTNSSRHCIVLPVGKRVAQITFLYSNHTWSYSGKYQRATSIDDIIAHWSAEDMLPKLYLDDA
jgi:dCTP deaminase